MEFGKNANKDIREMMNGIKYYEVAYFIGIDRSTFARWLATPLSDERREATIKAIKAVKKNGGRKAV